MKTVLLVFNLFGYTLTQTDPYFDPLVKAFSRPQAHLLLPSSDAPRGNYLIDQSWVSSNLESFSTIEWERTHITLMITTIPDIENLSHPLTLRIKQNIQEFYIPLSLHDKNGREVLLLSSVDPYLSIPHDLGDKVYLHQFPFSTSPATVPLIVSYKHPDDLTAERLQIAGALVNSKKPLSFYLGLD